MAYKDKIAQTANGIKETKSVLFIETLLVEKVKTDIKRDNTQATIDGYIYLLDAENKVCGNITVQVKTVNKKDEGHNKYPCPTSLFAYAENNPDNVFLLAVDHSQNKVLFKHISRKILKDNRDKEDQDTITLYFSKEEELKSDNVDKVIALWKSICKDKVNFFDTVSSIKEENEALKVKLLKRPEYINTFSESDIKELQVFSDRYNDLLNNSFNYIKRILFPNVWKRGIAVYLYSDSSLEYSLFNIKEGELLPPIMQLPPVSIFGITPNHDYASFSCKDNDIHRSPIKSAISLIKKHVEEFVKSKRIIPTEEIFLIEYVHEFVEANSRQFKLPKYSTLNVDELRQYLLSKYPHIDQARICSINNGVSINTIYDALTYLSKLEYKKLSYPYPRRGIYANTGYVSDLYSSETALEKLQQVVLATFRAYQAFIQTEFPLLYEQLDLFYGSNLIAILLDYSNTKGWAKINVCYLKSIVPCNDKFITVESITSSEIMEENAIVNGFDLWGKETVIYKGQEYKILRCGNFSDKSILFGRYNCLTFFYDLLKEHFKDYFQRYVPI